MAKKTAVKRVRTNKSKVAFEAYVAKVAEFLKQLQNRTSTEHSKTPANATRDGKTGPATVLVTELVSVVKTANKLNNYVVLKTDEEGNLIVSLNGAIPSISYDLWHPVV